MPRATNVPPNAKAVQHAATHRHLLAIARELFTDEGYAQAATEEIVQRAGLTRGALYHHFANKQALFLEVLGDLQDEVAQRVATAAGAEADPWQQLLVGCRAFLAASLDPRVQRIMLIDGPAVVGWVHWRAMDAERSMKLLQSALEGLQASGVVVALPLDALTHLLSGAMNEAALWIATAPDQSVALEEAMATLTHLLDGLRVRLE
jgi:AcrR family transcriptional regulator